MFETGNCISIAIAKDVFQQYELWLKNALDGLNNFGVINVVKLKKCNEWCYPNRACYALVVSAVLSLDFVF